MKILRPSAAVFLFCLASYGESRPEALFQAIRNNDLAMLQSQLAKGADADTRDNRGNTLLMHAAAFGSPEAVQLLLDAKADVNARNSLGATALIWAATDLRKAPLLIAKGADVNAHSNLGRTPLMIAATCSGCSELVRLFLEKGAAANLKDSRGTSAARLAAGTSAESLRLILGAGARPDDPDTDGFTPLMSAAAACDLGTVKMLLSKGANVNAANTYAGKVKAGEIDLTQLSSLMLAVPFCPAAMTKTLLAAGADVNHRDSRGMSPLMLAIASETQDIESVRRLIAAGADVNARSKIGESVLDWAKKFNHPAILAMLNAAGARPGESFEVPERPPTPRKPITKAVEAAVASLQDSSTEFFRQSGCVGCHHQAFTVMAVSNARSRGAHVDEAADREHVKTIEAQWTRLQGMVLERFDVGGGADQEIYSLLALEAAHYPGNHLTDSLVAMIASDQSLNGSWSRASGVARPPAESGNIARTALAARALQLYGSAAQKTEFDSRLARARGYLSKVQAKTNDDAAMQLAGLHWLGVDRATLRPLGEALVTRQRSDGGWATIPSLPSDAFATGQTLWSLREIGVVGPEHSAYKRGVKYLLDTQWNDGSWYVRSRSPKFQPYFQSGFPYDHDQWISATATAWAAMALSRYR